MGLFARKRFYLPFFYFLSILTVSLAIIYISSYFFAKSYLSKDVVSSQVNKKTAIISLFYYVRNKFILVGIDPKYLPIFPKMTRHLTFVAPIEVSYKKLDENKYEYSTTALVDGNVLPRPAGGYFVPIKMESGQKFQLNVVPFVTKLLWRKEIVDEREGLSDSFMSRRSDEYYEMPYSFTYIKRGDLIRVVWVLDVKQGVFLVRNVNISKELLVVFPQEIYVSVKTGS